MLTYGSCLWHDFLLDDFWQLDHARQTSGLSLFKRWEYTGEDLQAYWFAARNIDHSHEPGFFRPLVTMIYSAGLHGWGAQPMIFHLLSLLLHLATTAVVFWLAWRLFAKPWVAALGAAIYGLHPGQYEAVVWIAANADALLGFLGVLSVAAYLEFLLRPRRRMGFLLLSLAAFLLALTAKEMAAMIPAVLLALDYLHKTRTSMAASLRQGWRTLAPFWLFAIAFGVWHAPAAQGIYRLNQGGSYMADLASPSLVPQVILNFALYVMHMFFLYPVLPLNFAEQFGPHLGWIAMLALAGLIVLARTLDRFARPARKVYWLGVWWIIVTLLPFCIITPAQRLVHFPLAGLALLAGALALGIARRVESSPIRRNLARSATAALLLVYIAMSISYTAALGTASDEVRRISRGIDEQIAPLPAGSEIYLINLWQPAWMVEHLFAVRYPQAHFRIHVLCFDPKILNEELIARDGLLARSFARWFPDEVGQTAMDIHWNGPRTLVLTLSNASFFHGPVESELPIAAEANTLNEPIDAGPFIAQATRADETGITQLTFRWKPAASEPQRRFLYWNGQGWLRLTPPGTEPSLSDAFSP